MYYNIQATAALKPLVNKTLLTTAVNCTITTNGYNGSNKLYKYLTASSVQP